MIVKGDTNQVAQARTSTMSGDAAKPLSGATALGNDRIQTLDANGFTIGRNNAVNANGTNYAWTAFKTSTGVLKLGTYTGNGTSQSITGVGFSPEYVAHDRRPARTGRSNACRHDVHIPVRCRHRERQPDHVLNADGFSVGSDNTANRNGTVFHYIAFNDVTGIVDVNSYTGNNTDNRNITGVGFQPDYVMVRANDTATAQAGPAQAGRADRDELALLQQCGQQHERHPGAAVRRLPGRDRRLGQREQPDLLLHRLQEHPLGEPPVSAQGPVEPFGGGRC